MKSTAMTVVSNIKSLPMHVAEGALAEVGKSLDGFLMTGKTTGGTKITKPLSKRDFVRTFGPKTEKNPLGNGTFATASAAVRGYYDRLGNYRSLVRADFNYQLDSGFMPAAQKVGNEGEGRRTYVLFEPKAQVMAPSKSEVLKAKDAEIAALKAKIEVILSKLA